MVLIAFAVLSVLSSGSAYGALPPSINWPVETPVERELRTQKEARERWDAGAGYQEATNEALDEIRRQCGPIDNDFGGLISGGPVLIQPRRLIAKHLGGADFACVDFYVRVRGGRLAHNDCRMGRVSCP